MDRDLVTLTSLSHPLRQTRRDLDGNTIWAWLITLSTVAQLGFHLLELATFHFIQMNSVILVAIAVSLMGIFFAALDEQELDRRGFRKFPHFLWAMFPPIYLWRRGVAISPNDPHAYRLVWVYVITTPTLFVLSAFWASVQLNLSRA